MEKCSYCKASLFGSAKGLEYCINCGKYISKEGFASDEEFKEEGEFLYGYDVLKIYNDYIMLDDSNLSRFAFSKDKCKLYFKRGIAYQQKECFEEAIANFTKAIELDPQDYNLYHHRGWVYRFNRQYEEAIADYTKAIEGSEADRASNPKPSEDSSLEEMENMAHNDDGSGFAEVFAMYNALGSHGYRGYNPAFYLNNRAYVYKEKGELDKAIADLNKVLELQPDYSSYWDSRAEMYETSGEYQKAIDDCEEALRLDPNNDSAQEILKRCKQKIRFGKNNK
ncbi:MAG: tetratricopeptide repeat protein [Treponema sp.]|nr:tetratricopeptide repeat protein [Treponema sp.]MCL2251573.1 tetratricopeptide repeat protein [Treponema sp.]